MIRYLSREDIYDKKWNGCVHFGFNGLPYGYSWYLDQICEHWDGIVLDDYVAVLPLVKNKKFGIEYMFQPMFAQQLGIFSLSPLDNDTIERMYAEIPKSIKFIEIQINSENKINNQSFAFLKRTNLLLDLSESYETIAANYSGNNRKNIRRAQKNSLSMKSDIKPETFVEFFEINTSIKIPEYKKYHHFALLRLIYNSIRYNVGSLYGVFNDSETLIAAGFFVYNKQRIINLVPTSSQEGKEKAAMTFLIDCLIRINQPHKKIFDFEGSSIESISRFYKGFGARENYYWQIKRNNLPWFARLIKK